MSETSKTRPVLDEVMEDNKNLRIKVNLLERVRDTLVDNYNDMLERKEVVDKQLLILINAVSDSLCKKSSGIKDCRKCSLYTGDNNCLIADSETVYIGLTEHGRSVFRQSSEPPATDTEGYRKLRGFGVGKSPINCRHCVHMTCGDVNWCDVLEDILSDSEISEFKGGFCRGFEWCDVDALTFVRWVDKPKATKECDGQTRFEV